MAAASVSSFDGLAGQELASRLDRMMEKLHLQLCEKIRHEYLIRRDGKILWSGDGVSPHSEEEENHVSSENKEGRLDDDSGSNDVRLNFLPDGGGIEEPEHKTAETLISHGTYGIESFVQSFIVQWLREHVNLDNRETTFQNFDPDDESGSNDVRLNFPLDGGGIEEPEHKTAETLISQGTDGLERSLPFRIACLPPLSASPSSDLSTDGVSTGKEEEDNYVSATIEIGRLDDDSGNNDGGGIEEPEHKTAETVGSHGTDGLESLVQSVIVPFLRQEDVNLDNQEKILDYFKFEDILRINPSYIALLKQIINNVSTELSQMLKANPESSSEEFELYYVPSCWSSMQRVHFFCHLSDTLLKAKDMAPNPPDEPKDLISELERKGRLLFVEKWINRIDREWIDKIDPQFKPHESNYKSVRGLLRFMRNRWHHPDKFQESKGLRSTECFYNYFHKKFPNLLRVSYEVAYRFCRGEPWFKELCRSETFPGILRK